MWKFLFGLAGISTAINTKKTADNTKRIADGMSAQQSADNKIGCGTVLAGFFLLGLIFEAIKLAYQFLIMEPLTWVEVTLPGTGWAVWPFVLLCVASIAAFGAYVVKYWNSPLVFPKEHKSEERIIAAVLLLYPAIIGLSGSKAKLDDIDKAEQATEQSRYAEEHLQAERESVRGNWNALKEDGSSLMRRGKYAEAQANFRKMLDARPDDAEVRALESKAISGLQREDARLAAQKQKLAAERKEKQNKLAQELVDKKRKIKALVDEFAAGLPSPMGQYEFDGGENQGFQIDQVTHPYDLHWLNSAKTKAKVKVSTYGEYIWRMDIAGFHRRGNWYKGGTFVCEEDPNGNWHMTN